MTVKRADTSGENNAEGESRRLEELLQRPQIPWRKGMPDLLEGQSTRRFEKTHEINAQVAGPVSFNEHGDLLHPAIYSLEQLIVRFGREKRNGKRVVFTNGGFDLLHPGHIHSLESASALGDVLIVGINGDESMRILKGEGRPLIPAAERAEILASLECVDGVVIFEELSPQKVIAALLPDVLVKGSDWPGNQIVGREEVEGAGGKVVLIENVPGYSTTEIVKKIRRQK